MLDYNMAGVDQKRKHITNVRESTKKGFVNDKDGVDPKIKVGIEHKIIEAPS